MAELSPTATAAWVERSVTVQLGPETGSRSHEDALCPSGFQAITVKLST